MNERKSFQIQKNIADNKNMIYGNKKEFYQQYNKLLDMYINFIEERQKELN